MALARKIPLWTLPVNEKGNQSHPVFLEEDRLEGSRPGDDGTGQVC